MNAQQKRVYFACTQSPPTSVKHSIGMAYWMGRSNPQMTVSEAGPNVGLPGSDTRAAFMAGRDFHKRAARRETA